MKNLLYILFLPISVFSASQLYLAIVDNRSDETYKYSRHVSSDEAFVVAPNSIKNSLDFTTLSADTVMQLACVSGGNPDIYLTLSQGTASGECKSSSSIPKALEIWTDSPTPPSSQKNYVRYCLDNDPIDRGFIGLRILQSGEPALFEVYGVDFLDKDIVVTEKSDEAVA